MDNKKDLVVSLFTDYCGGNKDAFAQLYTETLDYTYRIVRLFIASEQDAEDMVQNVYLKVLEKADTLKNPDCFYTWLRRVTENECKNHLKKHKPVLWSGTQEDFDSSINSERDIVSTEVSVETDEVNKMLFEAIETLPQEKQVCLQLFYFEGADIAEIASALGIPQGTVKTRLFVSRKKLEKELKKSGVGKDVFYSVGIIPLIASAFAWHSSKVHAPAALASKASAIASGAAAPTAAAAGVTVASAAGVTAGVVLPKIAAVVTAAAVATGGGAAVKTYVEHKKDALVIESTADEAFLRSEYVAAVSIAADTTNTVTSEASSAATSSAAPSTVRATAVNAPTETVPVVIPPAASTTVRATTTARPTTTKKNKTTTAKATATAKATKATEKAAEKTTAEQTTKESDEKNYSLSGGTITSYTGSASTVTIPRSVSGTAVTAIGRQAFMNNTAVTSVTMPSGITSIGLQAFSGCSSLSSVSMPSTLNSIGMAAFYGCTSLRSVSIPSGTQSIGDEAFAGCSELKTITIPDSVTSIADDAFDGCDGLTIVCSDGSAAHEFAVGKSINTRTA